MDGSEDFMIEGFTQKCLSEWNNESQAFHYGKIGTSIHGVSITLLETVVPNEVLVEARNRFN